MKTLSLKLQDQIFEETEFILEQIKRSRNAYINEAVDFYNKYQRRQLLAKLLEEESKLVAEHSMEVLREMEQMDDDVN